MFDLARQEMESEWNAHYDYLSEAYGPTARDANKFGEDEFEYYRQEAISRGEWHQTEFVFAFASLEEVPF